MNDFDLQLLRGLRDRQRSAQLAARICASLDQPPRPLPSRVALAVESMARRTALVATACAIVTLGVDVLVRDEPTPIAESVIAGALSGDLPRAQDVFTWMGGMTGALGDSR